MRKIATMNIIRRCIIEIIFVSICFIFSEVQAVDAELTPNQDESNINKIKEFNIDLDDIDKTDINVCIEDPDITFEFGEFTEYIGYTLEKLRTIEKKDAFCAIRACDDALKNGGFKYSTGEENLLYAVKRDLDGKLPYFFNSFQRGYWFHLNKTQKGGLNLEKRTTLSWCLIQVLRDDLSKSVFKHEFSSKKKSSNIISTLGFFAQELDPTPQRIPNFAQEYEMMLKRDPNFAQEYVSSEENPGLSLPPKKRLRIVSDVLAEAGPSQSGDRMNINVIEPAVAGIIGGTSQAADVGSSQIGNPILEPGPIQREEPMEINTLESAVPRIITAQSADAHQVFSGSPQADDGQLPKKRRRQPKAGPSLPPKKRLRIVSDVLAEAGPSQSGDRMNINVIEPAVAGIIGGTSQAADVGSSQIGNPILEPGPSQIGNPILEPGQPKNKRVRKPKAGPIQREEPMEINTLESAVPRIITAQSADAHQVFSGSPQADDGQLPKKRRRQPKAGTLHFEGPTDINVLGSVPPEVLSVTAYAVDGQAKKKGARNSKAGPIQRAEPLQINILESSMIRNPMLEPTLPGTLGVPAQATDDVPGIIDEAAEAAKALEEKKKKYATDRKRRYREKNAREQAEKEKEAQRNGESRANPFDTLQELSARHIAMQPMRNQQPLTNLMLGGFDEKSDDVSQQDIASISDLNPRLLNLLEDQANARRTEQAKINQPINTDLTLGVKPDAQIIDFFEERDSFEISHKREAYYLQIRQKVNQPINTNLTLGKIDDPVQREEPMELINVFASDMKRKEEANRKRKNMENYRLQNDTPHFSILRNTNPELLQENRSQIRANQAKINQLPDIELVDLSEEPDANVRINNAEIAEQSQNYQQPDTDLTLGVITDKSADVRTNNYGFEQAKSNQVFDTDLTLRAIGGNSDANMRTNNYGRTEQAKRNAIIDTGLILGAIGGNSDDIPQQGRVSTSGLNRIYSTHPNTVDDISQQGTASNLGMNRIYSTLPNTVDNISQLDRVNTSGLNRIYSTLPNTVEGIYQQGGASTSGMNRTYSALPNTVYDTSQLGRVSTSGLNRIYSTLPNTVDDISQQGGPSTSRFNNIFQHGGASTSRFNNISQQGRVSTLGLNRNYFNLPKTYDISQQGGASTSRLNRISLPNTTDDISHQAIANTLGLNRIHSAFPNTVDDVSQQVRASTSGLNRTYSAFPNTVDDISQQVRASLSGLNNISQQGRASTSGLNNITQQGRASTSGLNNISQQVRASTSGLNNTSQQGGASISRLNRISLPNTIGDILQQNIASTTGLNTNIPNLPNPADGKVLVWATIKVCVDEIEFARTNDFATLYSAYLFVQKSNSDSPYAKSPKDWCNHVYL